MNGISRRMTIAAVSGGLGFAALGLGAGAAQADYYWFEWCPGQSAPAFASDRPVDWNWNVCHKYRYDGNTAIDDTGRVYPAPPPPPGAICGTDMFTGIPIPC